MGDVCPEIRSQLFSFGKDIFLLKSLTKARIHMFYVVCSARIMGALRFYLSHRTGDQRIAIMPLFAERPF